MAIKIITDSASNLGQDLLEKYDIDIVTLQYELDGAARPCYDPNITYEEHGREYYNALRQGKRIKTSLASPNQYYECFKKYLDNGDDIMYFSISSKLSGTLNSARNAKMMLEEEYPERKIICMDSMSASFGEAIIAIEASKLVKQGKTVEEIVEHIENIRLDVRNEFTVEDLTYLKTGGRIQSIIYTIGNFLGIKPMLRASKEATIELVEKVRGRKKSLQKLVETVKNTILNPENQTLYIAHCDCHDDVKIIEESLKKEVPNIKEIYISMYDFCTGAHVGPGTIAIFYFGKTRS